MTIASISEQTVDFIQSNGLTRFHLGCGANFFPGWLNINFWTHLEQGKLYGNPNQTAGTVLLNHDLRLGLPAEDNRLDAIYHSYLLEHLAYFEGLELLQKCYDALKFNGIHRLVVPDLEAFARAYLTENSLLLDKYKEYILKESSEFYQTKASVFMSVLHSREHKCGYDWETLRWALERAGFK